MLYQTYKSSPLLAPYVRFFWVLEADVAASEEFVHRSMADGSVEIVFHYRGTFDELNLKEEAEPSPLTNIQAQSTGFRRFSTRESFGIFGCYLYPFAIPRLFSLPASDLTNMSPNLESVLGPNGRRLEQRVIAAANNEQRVDIVSRFLEERLTKSNRELHIVHRAIHSVLDAKGSVNIIKLAREHSLSTRQFERKFKEFAGLNPSFIRASSAFRPLPSTS